jgi:ketosteroid isomerase-like protein
MSQENVKTVRRFTDAVNQGDREAAAAVIHPKVEWHTRAGPILGVEAVCGRDEVIRFVFEQIPDGIEDFRVALREVRALPTGQVLVAAHYDGRGAASGADVEMDATQIYRFDGGKIIFFQDFATRSEALEAAGLSE